LIYLVVMAYLLLMSREFFISSWLKKHPFWYVVSHMMIVPLIDVYASGLDWLLEDAKAPTGLLFFFGVSFMNGIVLEIGRKIRVPEKEEVNTYSTMMGATKATWLWLMVLIITLLLAVGACWYAGYGQMGVVVLCSLFIICCLPAFLFLYKQSHAKSKFIEWASALWTIGMYLSLGGIPMLKQLLVS